VFEAHVSSLCTVCAPFSDMSNIRAPVESLVRISVCVCVCRATTQISLRGGGDRKDG
jgi:hypothetical protein